MPSIDTKAVALIAAGSAAVTYTIAKRQFDRKVAKDRQERYEADQVCNFDFAMNICLPVQYYIAMNSYSYLYLTTSVLSLIYFRKYASKKMRNEKQKGYQLVLN